jgi:hypothetical protein
MLGEKDGQAAKTALVGLINQFTLFKFSHELGAGDILNRYLLEKASFTRLLTHDPHHGGVQCGTIHLNNAMFPAHMHR